MSTMLFIFNWKLQSHCKCTHGQLGVGGWVGRDVVCNLLRHNQILLSLTASLSGVEISGFSCLCSQFLLPKRGVTGQGGSLMLPLWCTACCAISSLYSLEGYIKIPGLLLEWSQPAGGGGIAAELLPRLSSQFLKLYFDWSFQLNRHKLFLKWLNCIPICVVVVLTVLYWNKVYLTEVT